MNSAATSSSGDGVKRPFIASEARNERLPRKDSAEMLFNALRVASGKGGSCCPAFSTGRKAMALSRQLPVTMSQAVRLNGDAGMCALRADLSQVLGKNPFENVGYFEHRS